MKPFMCILTAAAVMAFNAAAQQNPPVEPHYDKAGKEIKKGAKDAKADLKDGEVVAGAKDVGKGVGKSAKETAKGTKNAAKVAADKTEDVGEATVKGVKKGAKVTADKAEDVGEATVKGTKKAANKVTDALDGKNEKDTSKAPPR